jgi:ankyrin repeat protein
MLTANEQLAHEKNERGISAVLMATYYGQKDVVEALLSFGIELNIFEAAATGRTERLQSLILRDKSLTNAFSSDGFMPLGLAVFFGHTDAVNVLLDTGAQVNINSQESMKVTPLHSAVAAHRLEIGRTLIARGANVNAVAASGYTPLHEAAASGQIEFARLLLQHGANLHAKSEDCKTPLDFACDRKQEEMAAFLRKQ